MSVCLADWDPLFAPPGLNLEDFDSFVDGPAWVAAAAIGAGDSATLGAVLAQSPAVVRHVSVSGVTLLALAVGCSKPDAVAALLAAGADPNGGGLWCAPVLAAHHADDGYLAQLLAAGANPDCVSQGWSAAQVAILMDAPRSMGRLLDAGADIEASNAGGVTLLLEALLKERYGMADLLLARGASIWPVTVMGLTAGLIATQVPCSGAGRAQEPLRQRVIERLQQAGFPFPPPPAQALKALAGRADFARLWPPVGAAGQATLATALASVSARA